MEDITIPSGVTMGLLTLLCAILAWIGRTTRQELSMRIKDLEDRTVKQTDFERTLAELRSLSTTRETDTANALQRIEQKITLMETENRKERSDLQQTIQLLTIQVTRLNTLSELTDTILKVRHQPES